MGDDYDSSEEKRKYGADEPNSEDEESSDYSSSEEEGAVKKSLDFGRDPHEGEPIRKQATIKRGQSAPQTVE